MLARGRKAAAVSGIVAVIVTAVAGCGGGSAGPHAQSTAAAQSATAGAAASSAAPDLAVPGIPDPCALLAPVKVLGDANIELTAKSAAVQAAGGGRSCAYNPGRPDQVTISLTPISKASFDTFRNVAQGKITDLPGVGQEAYWSSQTPGVIDVLVGGFDLNVWVIHADSTTQSIADAKTLAVELAPKV